MVGQFSLSFALTAPAFLLANLKLRSIQATDHAQKYDFGDYLNLRFALTFLALLYVILIAVFTGYQAETVAVIIGVGLAKSFEAVSDIFYGLMQQRERMDFIASSMISKGLLSLLAIGLIIFFTKNLVIGVYSMCLIWAMLLLFYDMRRGAFILNFASDNQSEAATDGNPLSYFRKSRFFLLKWNWGKLTSLGKMAFPLGLQSMLGSLITNIPIYFLSNYYSEDTVGLYSALAYIMVVGNTITLAAGQAALPRLSRYYSNISENRKNVRRVMNSLILVSGAIGISGVLIAIFAGREILTLIYNPQYGKQSSTFVWLMVAAGFSYLYCPFWYSTTALRLFRQQTIIFLVAVISIVISCWLLVPSYSLIGAAWAIAIANAILFLGSAALHYYFMRRVLQQKIDN